MRQFHGRLVAPGSLIPESDLYTGVPAGHTGMLRGKGSSSAGEQSPAVEAPLHPVAVGRHEQNLDRNNKRSISR